MKSCLLLLCLLAGPTFAQNGTAGEQGIPLEAAQAEDLTPFQIRHVLREARRLYEAHDEESDPAALAEAAHAFALAAEKGEPGEVNLDAVRLAEAMAWMRADRPEAALEAFEKIQGFDEAADRARHRLLRGNAHLAAGERAFSQEDFDAAKEQMGEAIESYIASLMDDPASEAAKQNLELAHRRLKFVKDEEGEYEQEMPQPGDDEEGEEGKDEEGEDEMPPRPVDELEGEEDEDGEQVMEPEPDDQPGEEGDETEADERDPDEDDPEGDPAIADPGEEDEPLEGEMAPEVDDLTDEEIESTLNALLEQERRLRDEILRNRHRRQIPVEKDW
ncbi:MAG: hypothetical protein JJU29_15795 [Verrucomicrobia bacterium]|nr:hypothetical protein [Verrucomicrobiota bacterium]MCH8514318.1 hypothetical protein [Kiritimatiellia bacterium]